MKQEKLENLFDYLPKSKIKAGDGFEEGKYPFYTSSENQSKYLNEFQHGPGCLVFGTGGKASVHLTTSPFATSTDCISIKPKPNAEIDAAYVFQYFKGNMQILVNGFKGAGLKHISKAYLSDIKIPYPEEVEDQIRIAHLLGKVEGLIAQRKQHLQQLDDLLKSVFLEMFGDPVRNEKGWAKHDFETIILGMRNGLSPSKSGTTNGKVYTLSAITGDSFREIFKEDTFSQINEKYFPSTSDFLICRGNGNINLVGKGYFFPKKSEGVMFPDTIIAVSINPRAVNKHFFEVLWKTGFIRKQVENNARTTNGAHKINQGVIEKIKIILPPDTHQDKFATIVEKIEALKSRYRQSLSDLQSLYGALSQQAFKGELDLSRVPLPDVQSDAEAAEPTEKVETPVEEQLTINLPDTDYLSDALADSTLRQRLLSDWLKSYCQQIGNTSFSASDFLAAAQTRMTELHPDTELELSVDDYDIVKNWVFDALKSGLLQQAQNVTGHDENEDSILGNLIELRAGVQP